MTKKRSSLEQKVIINHQRGNQNWCKGASVAVLQILLGMDGSRERFDYA
jgi:hypothetical protein